MKIAIVGAQGVGKTTLAQDIVKALPEFTLLPEAARLATEAGYKLDLTATLETETWLIMKQLELERTEGKWVADRCFIDLIAYISYLFKHEPAFIEVAAKLIGDMPTKYDLVLYCPVGEFPIENDQVRFTDQGFQKDIDQMILWLLRRYRIEFVIMKGTPKQRLAQVKKLIK